MLDASALLTLLLGEPEAAKVRTVLDGALVGAVNLAEIVSHYAKLGASRADIEAMLAPLPVRIVPVDTGLSYEAGMLRPLTRPSGLSLGDRYCLALAKREQVPAVTAERRWPDIAEAVGVKVELIR
ncbi:MAG: type II toxin-antitoxin system VapC family toxin [Janthinobacterium lividum]